MGLKADSYPISRPLGHRSTTTDDQKKAILLHNDSYDRYGLIIIFREKKIAIPRWQCHGQAGARQVKSRRQNQVLLLLLAAVGFLGARNGPLTKNQSTMMKIVLTLFALLGVVNAATRIAVVELGVGGTVRRTSSQSNLASVEGVNSFIQTMHGGRKLQHAGMPVVPDLFQKADSGVILGVSGQGVDVAEMPSVAALLEEEKDGVVGHLQTNGQHCHALVSRASAVFEASGSEISDVVEKATEKSNLAGVKVDVNDSASAAAVDKEVESMIRDMEKKAKDEGKTVVVYLVIEEEASVARRRLQDQGGQGQNQDGDIVYFSKQDGQYYAGGNGYDDNQYAQYFAGYYGYGYYVDGDHWVTPYKTMFQIQYFNVVLWTAIGLVVVLIWVILMMMYMPLEPDTLLFGESAKMIGDD